MTPLAVLLLLLLAYGAFSARIERTLLTAPIVFTTVGIAVAFAIPGAREGAADLLLLRRAAELGLVLLLFTDASRIELASLRHFRCLSTRLLTIGLLLTLAAGALAARLVFPSLSWWEAGVLAAILAPTDAGLGHVIVSSPKVPTRIRQTLNAEAGLNDGLAVPFLLFFSAVASSADGTPTARLSAFLLEELGGGALVGVVVGLFGGALLGFAKRRGTMARAWRPLAVVMVPLLAIVACQAVHGSVFIAAFVAGLAIQFGYPEAGRDGVEVAEGCGQLLNQTVFFFFGFLVARALPDFCLGAFAYAALSLTIVRMLPIVLALRGTGLHRSTVAFIAWFGPRGLASIVLGLVYLEHGADGPASATIRATVAATVLVSIFAHGLTARPGIARYARTIAALPPDAPERAAGELEPGRTAS